MTKEEMLSAIYEAMADKTLSVGCYFLWRYWLFESQVMKHKLREVKKELVIVRDFFHSYEDIAELYLVESHNEFFLAKWERLIDERMYSKIRNKYISREWNFSKHHKIDKIIWHPVLIGDVLEYIDSLETWLDGKDKAQWRQNVFWLLMIWEKKKLDLTEQSDECIAFVHNLIKK